jgi:predicted O-methyltransferase YrrM
LTRHFGGTAAGWQIFLSALCGMGLLCRRRNNYRNSGFAARHLNHRASARLKPGYDAFARWAGLAHALTSGKRPGRQIPFASNQQEARQLLHSLDLDARKIAPYLLHKVPLKEPELLLDVGGGLGAYSIAFCQRYPKLEATLLEHPKIAPLARRAIREAGMAQRIRVVGLDIVRQPLPRGFDLALLSNVLHAHGEGENRSLLLKLHRALRPRGRLILRDVFMRDGGTAPEWGALFSVLLLLHSPRGRCYTLSDIVRWLRATGFSRITGPLRSSPLPFDPDSLLLARA